MGGRQGRRIIAPTRPAQSQTPSMLSIFGWMINPASCLGGWGSLSSLVILDDNLDKSSPLLLLSSSSAVESLLDCSLFRYHPTDDKDHEHDNDGKAAALRGPSATVPGLLTRVLALPCTLPPLPSLSSSSSYVNAPDYNDDLARDRRATLRRRQGGKRSTDATEALALLLRPGPTAREQGARR
jgi:hypothetical protein